MTTSSQGHEDRPALPLLRDAPHLPPLPRSPKDSRTGVVLEVLSCCKTPVVVSEDGVLGIVTMVASP